MSPPATTWTEMPVEWKPGSPATAPEQLTEERLKEEEYDQGLRTTFSGPTHHFFLRF